MTTGVACPVPILQFFDNNGSPLVGGTVLTQVGDVNAPTYSDSGLTQQLPNPIPLNSRGEISTEAGASAQLFLTPNTVYTFTVSDASGNQIWVATYVDDIQLSQALIGQMLWPQTAAEIAAGVTPANYAYQGLEVIDVLRYGIVPNNPNAAATNSIALQNLLNIAASGPTGRVIFPNTSGSDVYYFSTGTTVRDGIHIDLMGSTVELTGAATSADAASGFFFALRDFICENGTVVVNWDPSLAEGSGWPFRLGARGTDSPWLTTAYPSGVWDSLLPSNNG